MPLWLVSCSIESKTCELYVGNEFHSDYSLFINYSDSTYNYKNSVIVEIGVFSETNEYIYLFPKFIVTEVKATEYDCFVSGYFGQKEKCVDRRVYKKDKSQIKDETLSYFFFNDTSASSFNEYVPLQKVKIRQTKREREILYNAPQNLDKNKGGGKGLSL